MNPREPHDGLSAYFDGELNPSKQQEVESHLRQSADAQSEWTDIRRLSEEIRRLPKASAPQDLLSNVMNQIEAGAARSQNAKTPGGSSSQSLMGIGPWVAVAVALGVLIAWVPTFWHPSGREKSKPTIATHSPPSSTAHPTDARNRPNPRAAQEPKADNRPVPKMLGSEAELLAQQNRQSIPHPEAIAPAADQPQPVTASNTLNLRTQAGQGLTFRRAETNPIGDKNPTPDPQVADLLKRVDQRQGDEVVIVEVTVANASDSMKQFQKLLAGNQIAPTNFELPTESFSDEFGGRGRAAKAPNSNGENGLFVQSSRPQMLAALIAFRRQQTDSILQSKAALAWNAFSPEKESRDRQPRRKRANDFGPAFSRSTPSNEPKPGNLANPSVAAGSQAKKPQAEKAKTDAQPTEAVKSGATDSARPANAAPDLMESPHLPGKTGRSDAIQMLVPNIVLEKLAPAKREPAQTGEEKGAESLPREPAAVPTENSESQESPPLRVLFLFREPRQP